ncbi:MAG: hypothetical protein IT326_07605 [Anaerolineae bacterium]|nr:hypothetical protein [Anaerolineae bacterium]
MNLRQAANHCVIITAASLVVALLLAACDFGMPAVPTPEPGPIVSPGPAQAGTLAPAEGTPQDTGLVIARVNLSPAPLTIDPARLSPPDASGNDLVENLFVGLTRLDADTGLVEMELAHDWEVSEDGLTWTIFLRDDIFWVRINPDTGQMEKVRPVTAGDVVAGLLRACSADTAAPLGAAVEVVAGCAAIRGLAPEKITQEVIDSQFGARVLNDVAVEVRVSSPAANLPDLLAMPVFRPAPADLITEAGDNWTAPDVIWTSGRFAMQPGIPAEEGYTLVRNQFWPTSITGNVSVVQVSFVPDAVNGFESGELAALSLDRAPASPATRLMALPAASMAVFSYESFPFGNPGVRQAFALATDRQALIDQVLTPVGALGQPLPYLPPPGMAGAPLTDGTWPGYDPAQAQTVLADAGFTACMRFPQVTVLIDDSDLSRAVAEHLTAGWSAALGCPADIFVVEQAPLVDVVRAASAPPEGLERARAAIIVLNWQADRYDAGHWLAEIAGCRELFPEAFLGQSRDCGEADTALQMALSTTDGDERAALYANAAKALFGAEGEMPLIPLYAYARALAIQPDVTAYPVRGGALQFDRWTAPERP